MQFTALDLDGQGMTNEFERAQCIHILIRIVVAGQHVGFTSSVITEQKFEQLNCLRA